MTVCALFAGFSALPLPDLCTTMLPASKVKEATCVRWVFPTQLPAATSFGRPACQHDAPFRQVVGQPIAASLPQHHSATLPTLLHQQIALSPWLKPCCTVLQVRGTQALVDCLLEHASSLQADLIVMGSHQISKPDSALIGSVALSLLKKSER